MADDCEESNLERHSSEQSGTDVQKNESSHDDIDDLSEHIVSSFSTAGFTGQMLVDEVFKGFLVKKMEYIESEHQKVHKSKKKKSKDNEGSKARKHKHKKKHKNKSKDKDRDHNVDSSDIYKKEFRCDHSRSDAEFSRTDRAQDSQIELKEDKICENEYNLQSDKHTKSNDCDKISLGNKIKEEIIDRPAVEEHGKKERKCALVVDTNISGEITDCHMSNFVQGEDKRTPSKNSCKSGITDLKEGTCSDLSLSAHDRKLSKSFQDRNASGIIKSCDDDLLISCIDKKLVNSSERNVIHSKTIVSEGTEEGMLLCVKNEEESSLSGKNVTADNKNLSDLKKEHLQDSSLDLVNIHGEDKGCFVDHQSFGPECQKVEQQGVLKTTEVVDLCQSDSSNFVGESDILDSCHVSKSDNYRKEREVCRKREPDHRSSEKRSDEYKSKRHSHKKCDRESVDRDKKSKHCGSTSNNCRGHSKGHSRDRSTDRHPSSGKIRTTSSRTHEENKSRDTRCRSKERQRTRSTKSRSVERRHDSRQKSYERGSDKSDGGSRHKSKKQKNKPTREKSVEIIEEEEAESADASEKLTERLLRRLNTSIKKGRELKVERHSLLESRTSQSVDGTKPVVCSQTDASLVVPETEGPTPSEPIVLASGNDLLCASEPDPSAVIPDNIPVATARNESVIAATVKPTLSKVKKPAMKMGIRLTETSVAIISSGIRFESELKPVSDGKGDQNGGSESNTNEPHQGSVLLSSEEILKDDHSMISSVIADETKEAAVCSKQDNITTGRDANEKKSKKRKRSRSRSKSRGREDKKRRRERSVEKGRRSARNRSKDRNRRSNSRSEDSNRRLEGQPRGRGHRSRSTSKDRNRRAKIQSRNRDRRSRSKDHKSSADRKRSRSKSVEPKKPVQDLRLKIDKAKLREIAIKNVYGNLQSSSRQIGDLKPDAVAALKAGGKSVEELTDFCKRIAEKEKDQSADSPLDDDKESTDEEDKPFSTNMFKARDLASSIVLNIRNSKPLPILSSQEKMAKAAELRTQFPVSSGSQHRAKEWVPVEKPKTGESAETSNKKDDEKVFPDPPSEQIDVGHVVSERLSALRKLQSNPGDVQALGSIYKSQQKMQEWAASKQLPGLFVGSTGVNILSQKELMGNNPKNQAWVKKDTFTKARPVESGIGKMLLQRMGWREGEGLGKNNEGMRTPLLVDIKMDRKGLTSTEECPMKGGMVTAAPMRFDFSGKHPVCALSEICSRRRWNMPNFIQLEETGPAHSKMFRFKVEVNGVEYAPVSGSPNKKTAKLEAATVCLQQLGLLLRT